VNEEAKRAAAREQLIMDFQTTFSSDSGKRVLSQLSEVCFENKLTYVDGNPGKSAYNEGRRDVLLGIKSLLRANPHTKRQEEAE